MALSISNARAEKLAREVARERIKNRVRYFICSGDVSNR
jgi:hypothetical protein